MYKVLVILLIGGVGLFFGYVKVQAVCDPCQCGSCANNYNCESPQYCVARCCVVPPTPPPTCIPGSVTCGGCSASCGGGTQSCTNGCTTWSQNCNTQPCCSCGGWSNQACGSVTNGCGYETMKQTRSCNPSACASTSQCVANTGACFWPARVTGRRELVGSGSLPTNVPITFNSTSSIANPFQFDLADTIPSTVRQISLPADASFDIAWTRCYNNTTCHTTAAKTLGTQADILDDQIRANGNMFANPYADVKFYYCPKITTEVLSIQPNVSACVPYGQTTVTTTMTWTKPTTGSTSSYVVRLVDNLGNVVINNETTSCSAASCSRSMTITVGRTYTLTITPKNDCGGLGPPKTVTFLAENPPANPVVTSTDIGGGILLDWNDIAGADSYNVYKNTNTSLLDTVTVSQKLDAGVCAAGLIQYYVEAVDMDKAAGCQFSAKVPHQAQCFGFSDSWWAASGGGNLVAAIGSIRSKVPDSVFNPVLLSGAGSVKISGVEKSFPGLAMGTNFLSPLNDFSTLNDWSWAYRITNSWDASNVLRERENSYIGIKERILARAPLAEDITSAYPAIDNSAYPTVATELSGVKVARHAGPLTIGPLDMSGKKLLLLVDGDVFLKGENLSPVSRSVYWDRNNPGFLAVIAGGNITIDPKVGTEGLTMELDARVDDPRAPQNPNDPPYFPPHISGIFYAQGVFSTGSLGGGQRDRILKINGTVIGMAGVNLQRQNVGRYPVEFFNFQPSLVAQLSEVGLRRKIVRELLNP